MRLTIKGAPSLDFSFNEREELLKKSVEEFVQREVAPLVKEMEKEGRFASELIPKLAKMGVLGLITPPQYGGNGVGHVAKTIVLEEISKVCPGVGLTLEGHIVCTYLIQTFGSEKQKRRYLPRLTSGESMGSLAVTEASGGSDVAGIKTRARREGDSYYLTGRKCFISNSHVATIHTVLAKTSDEPETFALFIVENSFKGFYLGRKEERVGLRGATTGEIVLDECQVPAENLVGEDGDGIRQVLSTINRVGRPGMAAVAVGICYAALSEATKFARERTLYGKPISNLQAIQLMLADIYAQAEAARLLTYRAVSLIDQAMPADIEATLAKYVACEAAFNCAKLGAEIHGGYSAIKDYPIERLLRDALVTIPSSGTAQVAKVVLGRHVVKNL